MQPFFITSTGTDIGKTLVTTSLCWQLRQMGKTVTALKPVISGYDPANHQCDTAMILKSCDIPVTPNLMEVISPWRFREALAPNMAAARENRPMVSLDEVVSYCREHTQASSDYLLVEGVGGVMVPLNNEHTILDWMAALDWPVILVTGSYLGSISHTLTALEVIQSKGLKTKAIVICESHNSSVPLTDISDTLESFISRDFPIVKIPRMAAHDENWKLAPHLSWIVT